MVWPTLTTCPCTWKATWARESRARLERFVNTRNDSDFIERPLSSPNTNEVLREEIGGVTISPKTQGSNTIGPEQLDVDGLEHCLHKLYHIVSFRARLQQTHATDSTTPGQRVDESISQW